MFQVKTVDCKQKIDISVMRLNLSLAFFRGKIRNIWLPRSLDYHKNPCMRVLRVTGILNIPCVRDLGRYRYWNTSKEDNDEDQSIYSYFIKTAVNDVLVSLSGRQTMFFIIEIFGRCLVVNPFSYLVDTDCFFFVLTGSEKTSFLNATQNLKPQTPIGPPPYVYSSDCIRRRKIEVSIPKSGFWLAKQNTVLELTRLLRLISAL